MCKNIVIEEKYVKNKVHAFGHNMWTDIPPIGCLIATSNVLSYQILKTESKYFYIQVKRRRGKFNCQVN